MQYTCTMTSIINKYYNYSQYSFGSNHVKVMIITEKRAPGIRDLATAIAPHLFIITSTRVSEVDVSEEYLEPCQVPVQKYCF